MNHKDSLLLGQVLHVGPTRESKARAEARAKKYTPTNLDRVELWINKRNNLVFQGKASSCTAWNLAFLSEKRALCI